MGRAPGARMAAGPQAIEYFARRSSGFVVGFVVISGAGDSSQLIRQILVASSGDRSRLNRTLGEVVDKIRHRRSSRMPLKNG